jgi:Rod binding domain-containing protein
MVSIDQSLQPADVRNAPTEVRQQYHAALSFETQLVSQLAKQLSTTAGSAMQDGPYAQLLPDALADSITQAGGLGLARQMVEIPTVDDATATRGAA